MGDVIETTPGTFNWVDLMSPDVDASKDFYGAVFDWDFEDQHDDEGNRIYVMCSLRGRSVAGIGGQMGDMQGAPPVWNSYVATEDVDETTALVESAGGTVVLAPMDVFTSGRMAIYTAPDGAIFSVWQPGDHIGAELVDEHGAWTWTELVTRDLDAARPFYEQVFGWSYDEMDMGPLGTYHLAILGDRQVAGLVATPPTVPEAAPNHWAVYFATDDLDTTTGRITASGGQVVSEPQEVPDVGTVVWAHDAQRGSFAVIQPTSDD